MLGFNGTNRVSASVATAVSVTSAIDIRGANHISLEFQTFTNMSAASVNCYLQGCSTSDGTFRRVMAEGAYSAGVAIADWEMPANTGNKQVVCWPAPQFDYIKIEYGVSATAPMTAWVNIHY